MWSRATPTCSQAAADTSSGSMPSFSSPANTVTYRSATPNPNPCVSSSKASSTARSLK